MARKRKTNKYIKFCCQSRLPSTVWFKSIGDYIGSIPDPLGLSSSLRHTTLHISRTSAFSPSSMCSVVNASTPAFALPPTPFVVKLSVPTPLDDATPPTVVVLSLSSCSRTSRIWSARTTASGRPTDVGSEAVMPAALLACSCCSSWRILRSSDRTYWRVWSLSVGRMFSSYSGNKVTNQDYREKNWVRLMVRRVWSRVIDKAGEMNWWLYYVETLYRFDKLITGMGRSNWRTDGIGSSAFVLELEPSPSSRKDGRTDEPQLVQTDMWAATLARSSSR